MQLEDNQDESDLTDASVYVSKATREIDVEHEIDMQKLQLIGSGSFGKVYRTIWVSRPWHHRQCNMMRTLMCACRLFLQSGTEIALKRLHKQDVTKELLVRF
eukprot:SAG31_NODE_332_length_17516_cov_3.552840_14_plen_102_part_00